MYCIWAAFMYGVQHLICCSDNKNCLVFIVIWFTIFVYNKHRHSVLCKDYDLKHNYIYRVLTFCIYGMYQDIEFILELSSCICKIAEFGHSEVTICEILLHCNIISQI